MPMPHRSVISPGLIRSSAAANKQTRWMMFNCFSQKPAPANARRIAPIIDVTIGRINPEAFA